VALPDQPRSPWPPADRQAVQADVEHWDAWYTGDAKRLQDVADKPPRGVSERLRFWRTPLSGRSKQRLHVPIAADVATASSDLLFGEPSQLRLPAESATAVEHPSQAAFDELLDKIGFHNRLLESGEIAAALGGVYLRVVWDVDVAGHPLLTAVHPDRAVPDFRFDRLAAVTFWEEVHREGNVVWRHLERHEPGVILHGLYVGTGETLGDKVELGRHPKTAGFVDVVPLPAGLARTLAVDYVPNMLPNRKHRHLPVGRADYAGVEDLMDALDECYTSWMRDIRLGQSRIIVDETFLDRGGPGAGASFDVDREVFTPLNMDPLTRQSASAVTPIEFKLRVEEHERTATHLVSRIVDSGGYSPESFGIHEAGPADSGRALRIRQGKTFRTRGRKQGYWAQPIMNTAEKLAIVHREVFGGDIEPVRPLLLWSDGQEEDGRERAETAQLLRQARAASIRTLVKLAQPELEGDEWDAEVARVKAEDGIHVTDPAEAFPA
jgi:hypothetical protein